MPQYLVVYKNGKTSTNFWYYTEKESLDKIKEIKAEMEEFINVDFQAYRLEIQAIYRNNEYELQRSNT